MGVGTANALKKFNIDSDFIGKNEIRRVAKEFAEIIGEEKVLFPGAKNGKRSVQKILQESQVIDLPIYETQLKDLIFQETFYSVAFTSPSNVRAFFNSGNTSSSFQKAIAIGKSTEMELLQNGVKPVLANSYLEEDWSDAAISSSF